MKAGMIGDVEFKKAGSETVCCVSLINTTAGQRFLACTLSSSKTYDRIRLSEDLILIRSPSGLHNKYDYESN